jgi:hypothetical protein
VRFLASIAKPVSNLCFKSGYLWKKAKSSAPVALLGLASAVEATMAMASMPMRKEAEIRLIMNCKNGLFVLR